MSDDLEQRRLQRRQRERERVRGHIMDAALRVFARAGYHEANVEEIAREAGYSTGALYNYFRNKQDLFVKLVERLFVQVREGIVDALDRPGSFEQRLDTLLAQASTVTQDTIGANRFLFDPQSHAGFASDELHEHMEQEFWHLLDSLTALVQQGIDEGVLRPQWAPGGAHVLLALLQHFARGFTQTREDDLQLTPEIYCAMVKDYFLHGAGTGERPSAPYSPAGDGT